MVNFKLSKEVVNDFIGFVPEIKKWILEILAILYILGMIIVTQHLNKFNISEIKDIKIEYILVGFTFTFYILVPIIIIIYLLYLLKALIFTKDLLKTNFIKIGSSIIRDVLMFFGLIFIINYICLKILFLKNEDIITLYISNEMYKFLGIFYVVIFIGIYLLLLKYSSNNMRENKNIQLRNFINSLKYMPKEILRKFGINIPDGELEKFDIDVEKLEKQNTTRLLQRIIRNSMFGILIVFITFLMCGKYAEKVYLKSDTVFKGVSNKRVKIVIENEELLKKTGLIIKNEVAENIEIIYENSNYYYITQGNNSKSYQLTKDNIKAIIRE